MNFIGVTPANDEERIVFINVAEIASIAEVPQGDEEPWSNIWLNHSSLGIEVRQTPWELAERIQKVGGRAE